jgi:putative transposase
MPRKGRSNEEIVHALHQVEGGEKVAEVCRRLGVSSRRSIAGRSSSPGSAWPRWGSASLRHENAMLKQLAADLALDRHILQEIVLKKL